MGGPAQSGGRVALAVGVGGEDQPVGILERGADRAQRRPRAARGGVDRREAVCGVDRAVPLRQVADMAPGCDHLVAGAEIASDRLRLGWGFDDDDVHGDLPPMHAAPAPRRLPAAVALACCAVTRGVPLPLPRRAAPGQLTP